MSTRRAFLSGVGSGLVVAGCAGAVHRASGDADEGGEDVTPAEDLMREHGVLERVLLVYEESARRIEAHEPTPPAVASAAAIIRKFVEDYHEKLEENFLFPRFEEKRVLADLVAILRAQHQAGRAVTERITALAAAPDDASKSELVAQIRAFARMYRPHHAREDTVLFTALPKVIGEKELHELGDRFEDEEHRRFGRAGFEGVVAEVAQLEQTLGIYDLAQFTPKA
jgi:hemerythrin-like domain-containing protein